MAFFYVFLDLIDLCAVFLQGIGLLYDHAVASVILFFLHTFFARLFYHFIGFFQCLLFSFLSVFRKDDTS